MSVIVRALLRMLANLIPKDNRRIVFISNPDFSDNPKSLYEYLIANYPSYECTWLCKNKKSSSELRKRGMSSFVERTLRGFVEFSRARVIITSHNNLLPLKSKRQIYVNLWHGIALKAIGYMDKGVKHRASPKINDRNSITVSTSRTISTVLGACLHVNANNVFVTGLPRNDDLFHPVSDDELSRLLGFDVKRYKRIVLYMPTFRQGYLGRAEGKTLDSENIFRFEEFSLKVFQNYLAKNNILFLCKLHPFEEKFFRSQLSEFSRSLILLTTDDLNRKNLSLYRVVARANLLVTDYSSIFTDYLLLDRPIVFVSSDLTEYSEKRGLMLHPFDFWTPGPKVTSQDNLQNEISRSFEETNYYGNQRDTVRSIIHQYEDNDSSKRVANIVFAKLKRYLNSENG